MDEIDLYEPDNRWYTFFCHDVSEDGKLNDDRMFTEKPEGTFDLIFKDDRMHLCYRILCNAGFFRLNPRDVFCVFCGLHLKNFHIPDPSNEILMEMMGKCNELHKQFWQCDSRTKRFPLALSELKDDVTRTMRSYRKELLRQAINGTVQLKLKETKFLVDYLDEKHEELLMKLAVKWKNDKLKLSSSSLRDKKRERKPVFWIFNNDNLRDLKKYLFHDNFNNCILSFFLFEFPLIGTIVDFFRTFKNTFYLGQSDMIYCARMDCNFTFKQIVCDLVENNKDLSLTDIRENHVDRDVLEENQIAHFDFNPDCGDHDELKKSCVESLVCKICFARFKKKISITCGHITSCEKCSSNLSHCPFCKVKTEFKKVYFP